MIFFCHRRLNPLQLTLFFVDIEIGDDSKNNRELENSFEGRIDITGNFGNGQVSIMSRTDGDIEHMDAENIHESQEMPHQPFAPLNNPTNVIKELEQKIEYQNSIIANLVSHFKLYSEDQRKITAEIKVKVDLLLDRYNQKELVDSDNDNTESVLSFPLSTIEEIDTFNDQLKNVEYRMKIVSLPYKFTITL